MHWSFHPCPTGAQQPPLAAAGPSGGPPAPPPLLLRGGGGSPPGDLPPLGNPGGGDGGRGTTAELHGLATRVYALWAADFATEPRALALRQRAESTVFAWARELRGVGRTGLLYAELSRADALARHLAHLAAMGKSSAALRGTISAVRMAEKLQLLRPTVGPIHWAIAAGAGRAYHSQPGQQVKGAAVWVSQEHDDSAAPGQPAFTRRHIDMPARANGIWSRTVKEHFTGEQGGGRLVLSRTVAGLSPLPPCGKT